MLVKDLIDNIISHNEVVSVWKPLSKQSSEEIWHGMAHAIPSHVANLTFKRIFGTIPEHITQADTINILVQVDTEINNTSPETLDNYFDTSYTFETGM